MDRKYKNWCRKCIGLLITVIFFSACSDDHYDIKTGIGQRPNGNLWENLLATQQCDSFAMILQRTLVNKKDYGTPVTLTYENLLKSSKVMTIWAPQDGTYNAQYWLNLLDEGKNEVVEREFVTNHLAYFNYNGSYPIVKRIMLANQKFAVYDDSTSVNTFNEIPILESYKNVASSNGTLHVLEGISPFVSNLRQLLAKYEELSNIYEYVESRDTIVFLEDSSTPGTTINGEIHYVDSVFYEYNKMLPRIAENEDSLCAAIIPSNAAWDEAIERISKSFVYKNHYGYKENSTTGTSNMDTIKADSVSNARTMLAIFNNMFYSLYEQRGFDVKTASTASVGEFFRTCDSLQSTVYYSNTDLYHQHAPDCRELTEGKDPIEASNGYAFITDKFNFKAKDAWQYDIIFDGENSWYVNILETNNIISNAPTGITRTLTDGTRNPNISGTVRGDQYRSFPTNNASAASKVTYNIPNVCSGTYDIYVVLLPESMLDSLNKDNKVNSFTATLAYNFDESGNVTESESTTGGYLTNDPTKVDTVLLFENFKFPYAYLGLPVAKPYITLTSERLSSKKQRDVKTNEFNIDCFILKSKDE